MNIGIDYRFAVSSVRGIGYYIKEVVAQLMVLDKVNKYFLYVNTNTDIVLPDNFNLIKLKGKNLILFEQFYLPKQAKADQLDVLWCPSNSGPISLHPTIKLIVTVHDLAFKKRLNSQLFNFFAPRELRFALAERYRMLALTYGLKRINQLITVSDYSAKEIFTKLHRKAVVINNHISPTVTSNGDTSLLQKLRIEPKNYIYTLTGVAPHKALKSYIELFQNQTINKPLVISGVYSQKLIKKYASTPIIFSGVVTEEEKNTLYSNAYCFLFLSLEEGFGLPLLEAMKHKLPIICTNRGALPEVGGQAVILVEPNDHSKVQYLLNDLTPNLPPNLKMLQHAQLNKYSDWKIAAKAHLALFEKEGRS